MTVKSSIYPIDIETGEVVPGIQMIDEEDRARRKLFAERQHDKTVRRKDHIPLGEFYMTTCRENQFEGLQPQDVARLVFLATFMNYDGVLTSGDKCLAVGDLPNLLEVSKSTFDRFWKKIKDRYIVESEGGALTVVSVFLRGKQWRIQERLTKVFIQQLQALYRSTPKGKRRLFGYIFQLIYCVNVEYNILAKNPLETELSRVEPLTIKEFAARIGYDESQLSRLEKAYSEVTFMCDGRLQHFCAFVDHGRYTDGRFVVINPRIFYAGQCYEQVDVLGLFFK